MRSISDMAGHLADRPRVVSVIGEPGIRSVAVGEQRRSGLHVGPHKTIVQKAAGHRDPGTTKLYDRRGYNPEKAASFFATY
jgi:hypothetical protein